MLDVNKISDAIKEVFSFLKGWNSADEKQKRYVLRRVRKIKKATDIAEEAFFVVDDMLAIIHKSKVNSPQKFLQLEKRYKNLVRKFNELD